MVYLYVWSFLQIIFESLPVSSSGNVLLWSHILSRSTNWLCVSPIAKDIDFILHAPTIGILVIFFRKQLKKLFLQCLHNKSLAIRISMYIACADGITCLWFLFIKQHLTCFTLSIGFCITAVTLFLLRYTHTTPHQKITHNQWPLHHACLLGALQAVALTPGISRFALTFAGARWLRYTPEHALFLSFFIQLPLLVLACTKGAFNLYVHANYAFLYDTLFYIIITGATLISYRVFTTSAWLAKEQKLHFFAWYMVLVTVIARYYNL